MTETLIKQNTHKQMLNKASLRATPIRIAILKLLEQSIKPVDVIMIIDHLKKENIDADPSTVFRIMNSFTQNGITTKVEFQEGKTRYELADQNDHHHLICERCGSIDDITECVVSTLEKSIKRKKRFVVRRHSLEFYGLCASCQK